MSRVLQILTVAALATSPVLARAQSLAPTSYDMPNGATGTFTYFDDSYTGTGCTTCSYSPLAGGLGDLTNGVTTAQNWTQNSSPFVGWQQDVSILFHFAVASTFSTVGIHFDGGGGTSVSPAFGVYIGADDGAGGFSSSQFFAVAMNRGAPYWSTFDVSGLGAIQNQSAVRVQFVRNTAWVMADEVAFTGQAAVVATPEPASVILLGTGLLGVMLARRRLRR